MRAWGAERIDAELVRLRTVISKALSESESTVSKAICDLSASSLLGRLLIRPDSLLGSHLIRLKFGLSYGFSSAQSGDWY